MNASESETRTPRTRRLMSGNPFYLLSATLMLFGIYRISVDPGWADKEFRQLLFNFSSLEVYETLLAITAAVLAARARTSESSLLVGIENVFLFTPFLLLTHATMLESELAIGFATTACVLLALRCGFLAHRLPEIPRDPALGTALALLTTLNVALPVQFRGRIENDAFAWSPVSSWLWNLALPAVAALSLALRERPVRIKPWTGPVLLAAWIAATGVHLRTIDYLDDVPFNPGVLTAGLWAAGICLLLRCTDWFPVASRGGIAARFWVLPLAAPFLSWNWTDNGAFAGWMLADTAVFTLVALRRRGATPWIFAAVALAIGTASLSFDPRLPAIGDLDPERTVQLTFALAALAGCSISRSALAAAVGGVLVVAVHALAGWPSDYPVPLALHHGFIFTFAHTSLRSRRLPVPLGAALAAAWFVHSVTWCTITTAADADPWVAGLIITEGLALTALTRFTRRPAGPGIRLIPLVAGANALSAPAVLVVRTLTEVPTGVLAVLASFALFGVATVLALRAPRRDNGGHTSVSTAAS